MDKKNKEFIDDIFIRITELQEKYKTYFLIYGNKEVVEAWKYFDFLGYWYQISFEEKLFLELRTLIENKKDTKNVFSLLTKIEREKGCKFDKERISIKNISTKLMSFINQNITHKSKNVLISSIPFIEIKNTFEHLKDILKNIVYVNYKEEYSFEVFGSKIEFLIGEFNNLFKSAHSQREKEKEQRFIKLMNL